MASAHPYAGPMSLENSKYATPMPNKALTSSSMASQFKFESPRTDTTMATSEQVAAARSDLPKQMASQLNSDTQLAIAHGKALKDEVDRHAARFSTVASTAVTNTRRLLELIREALPESAGSLVEAIWKELDQLHAAVDDAKAVLPVFLEKQRNSVSLYHTSLMNHMMQDTQHELNIQHNKANLQHNLILEHQEAFLMYKEQTDAKLSDMETLNERASRLTLEKGNLRTEIDKYVQLLQNERSLREEAQSKVDALQKEIETLLVERNTLRNNRDGLPDQVKHAQQEAEQLFTAELKSVTNKLAEQTEKATALQIMVAKLGESERVAKLEAENAKKEKKILGEKYDIQAAEHAKLSKQLNDHISKSSGLQANAERLQQKNVELQQREAKLADVETQVSQLTEANSGLAKEFKSLTSELNAARDEATKAKTERDALLKKAESLSNNTEHVDSNTGRLVGEQAQKIATLEVLVREWTDLAKRSYQEYKEILPLSTQAKQLREDLVQKEQTIKDLQEKLASATSSQASGDDVRYWKSKYEVLLESISK